MRSRLSWIVRCLTTVLVVVAALTIAPARPASATTSLSDADDTSGTLDIKDASVAFDSTNAVLTIDTYEAFSDSDGIFAVPIDLDSDAVADDVLIVVPTSSGLLAGLEEDTPRTRIVPVTHTGATLTVTIARSLLGGASAFDFNVLTLNLTSPNVDIAPDTPTIQPKRVVRTAGIDRIETAVKSCFAIDGLANGVVIARADGFADALSGGPLATAKQGCLLLTPTDSLDPRTLAEIQRVLPSGGPVYLLGGETALSANVASAVSSAGFDPVRIGGADRYETAAKVATDGLGSPSVAFLATGNDFPDALSAGPAASDQHGAILLTNGSSMPTSTASYLVAHPGATVYAIGGPAAAADPAATPIVGTDRFDTAVQIASRFFSNPSDLGFASGVNFPDALAGGAGMGNVDGPMLLTAPDSLPQVDVDYLNSNSPLDAVVFGGPAAVSDSVVTQLQSLI